MRGIMASLTMVSETSGSAGYFLASRRPGRASRVSAPPPAAREEDKARGPGEAPDYDRARRAQETGEPGREPVASAIGEHELEPRTEPLQPAQQVAGSIGVLDVGGRDKDTEQQTASERGVYSLSYWRVQLASGAPATCPARRLPYASRYRCCWSSA